MIKLNDVLPDVTVYEYIEVEKEGCVVGPNPVSIKQASANKLIGIFGVPGAFTPTCSAQHLPSYVKHYQALKAQGVDEIWCMAVNDAFVMQAWGKDQAVGDTVRMLADGSAEFSKATGLTLDLTSLGLGLRSNRYVLLAKDSKVIHLAIEEAGKYEVSSAEALLEVLEKSTQK